MAPMTATVSAESCAANSLTYDAAASCDCQRISRSRPPVRTADPREFDATPWAPVEVITDGAVQLCGRAMRAHNEQGMAKAIGVANFYPDRLVDLIDRTGYAPAVNQIETHPYFQRRADHDLMGERGVQHESWGGFAEGRNNPFSDPTLTAIAAHGKSVAQVVIRWLTQRNVVAIPKSVRPERMAQTSTSSTSPSPATRWPASPPGTPAPPCSSTTATPPWSAPSATGPSTTDGPRRRRAGRLPGTQVLS
jgi:hypothetical protein